MVSDVARVKLPGFDVHVDALTATDVVEVVMMAVSEGRSIRIANLNLHGLYMFETSPDFRQFTIDSDIVLIDGWPVWLLAKLRNPAVARATRIGSSDWLDALLRSGSSLRFVSVGGTEVSASKVRAEAMARSGGRGSWESFDGYGARSLISDRDANLDEIPRSDVLLVGMGMPIQERWISDHVDPSRHRVVANVGGCLDYLAGEQPLAPRWMGSAGLEWLYRLARSPRRLARRYLVEPWLLLGVLVSRELRSRNR